MTMELAAPMRKRTSVTTLTDSKILGPAVVDAFRKLDPRVMVRNPVMFTVEVVATLTTVLFVRDLVTGQGHGGSGLRFYERDYIEDRLHDTAPKVSIAPSQRKPELR